MCNLESGSLGLACTNLPNESEDTKFLGIERNLNLKGGLEERGQRGWRVGGFFATDNVEEDIPVPALTVISNPLCTFQNITSSSLARWAQNSLSKKTQDAKVEIHSA